MHKKGTGSDRRETRTENPGRQVPAILSKKKRKSGNAVSIKVKNSVKLAGDSRVIPDIPEAQTKEEVFEIRAHKKDFNSTVPKTFHFIINCYKLYQQVLVNWISCFIYFLIGPLVGKLEG